MTIAAVAEAQAKAEIAAEDFRAEVDEAKARIRTRRASPWWKRLLPFTIDIRKNPHHV